MILTDKWQDYFAGMAIAARRGSLDPSTKVGAVIYRTDRSTASTGFNGLPSAIPDDTVLINDRNWKLKRTIHAEANALDYAKECLRGCGIVVTAHPCSACTLKAISRGLTTIYYLDTGLELSDRWYNDMLDARTLCSEAGVNLIKLDKEKGRC